MDDVSLLQRYAASADDEALRVLVQRHQERVLAVCRRRLKSEADARDATQEVFLALMENAGSIRSNLAGWLYRCAVNTSISMIRSRRTRQQREVEGARHRWLRERGTDATAQERLHLLESCLLRLNSDDQSVLVRSQLMGFSQKEIATSLGVSQQAVAKRIQRLLGELRRQLTSQGVIFSGVCAWLISARRAGTAAARTVVSLVSAASGAGGGAAGSKLVATAVVVVTVMALERNTGSSETDGRLKVERSPVTALPAIEAGASSADSSLLGNRAGIPWRMALAAPAVSPVVASWSAGADAHGVTVRPERRTSNVVANAGTARRAMEGSTVYHTMPAANSQDLMPAGRRFTPQAVAMEPAAQPAVRSAARGGGSANGPTPEPPAHDSDEPVDPLPPHLGGPGPAATFHEPRFAWIAGPRQMIRGMAAITLPAAPVVPPDASFRFAVAALPPFSRPELESHHFLVALTTRDGDAVLSDAMHAPILKQIDPIILDPGILEMGISDPGIPEVAFGGAGPDFEKFHRLASLPVEPHFALSYQVVVAPEPGTLLLAIPAIAWLLACRRRSGSGTM